MEEIVSQYVSVLRSVESHVKGVNIVFSFQSRIYNGQTSLICIPLEES